jgi:deoxyribodipyrimidine photo-lyase
VSLRAPVVPVFIWSPEEEEPWLPGGASRWWLHQSLKALSDALAAKESKLIFRRGPTLPALTRLVEETGAQSIHWNRRYEPAVRARDESLVQAFESSGISVKTFNSAILFEPPQAPHKHSKSLDTSEHPGAFQVFPAFWKACLKEPPPAHPIGAPRNLVSPSKWPASVRLAEFGLEPTIDWAGGIRATWQPGEPAARQTLKTFLRKSYGAYPAGRNYPAERGTSRLSPHLHFGEISPREVWHALQDARTNENAASIDAYLREVGWREFAYHLLYHFPRTTNEPLRREFNEFPWRHNRSLLRAWQKGRTGYPLVDAGMHELWTTGWMHNRVRLVVASFLTKHLRISWEEGAYWFWDTLVDADLANNTLGWQWTAGCGADAAPFFRIFNPVLQSEKFDPEGAYIRRWLPQLSRIPSPWIHKPWLAPAEVLTDAGVQLGQTYPMPVVDHEHARQEALAAFAALQKRGARRRN